MIIVVVNNYGKNYDGIGDYAQNVYESIEKSIPVKVFTAETSPSSKLKRLLSFKMVHVFAQLLKYLKRSDTKVDSIIIEYPFLDCNPLIIGKMKRLFKICQEKRIPVFLSLHEYFRTSKIRQYIINAMIRFSDVLLVSNKAMAEQFESSKKKIYVREIPANIVNEGKIDFEAKEAFTFAFFGLINKAKAIDSLVEAWNIFYDQNKKNNPKLFFITASDVNSLSMKGCVKIVNASKERINSILSKTSFGILPIIPEINNTNASFKCLMSNGCVTIGRFANNFEFRDCGINIPNYSVDSLVKGFESAINLSPKALMTKQSLCVEKRGSFSTSVVSKKLFDIIQDGNKDYEKM